MPEHINNYLFPEHEDKDNRSTIQHNQFVGNTDFVGINNIKKYATVNLSESSKINVNATKAVNEIESLNSVKNKWNEFHETTDNDIRKLVANKVLPIANLPTYTVINQFAPSGYSSSNNSENFLRDQQEQKFSVQFGDDNRSPKLYFQQVINSVDSNLSAVPQIQPKRSFSTTTYYGFADFVTTVGDSVIVFSPSKTTENTNVGHITSISGEATLGHRFEEFVPPAAINSISPTYGTTIVTKTNSPIDDIKLKSEITKEITTENIELQNKKQEIEMATVAVTSNFDQSIRNDSEDVLEQEVVLQGSTSLHSSEIPSSDIGKNIQSTPNEINTQMYSRPSEEEILAIYASLSREANKKQTTIPIESHESNVNSNSKETKDVTSGIEVHGGATTIFFEEDPLSNFIEPTGILEFTHKSTKTDISQLSSYSSTNEYSKLSTEYEVKTANITQNNINSEIANMDINVTNENEMQIISSTCNKSLGCSDEFSETMTTTGDLNFDTTENPNEEQSNSNVINTENSTEPEVRTPAVILNNFIIEEINEKDTNVNESCIRTSQVFLTQVPKTITLSPTYLKTFTDGNGLETITSTVTQTNIISTFDITQATKHYCIKPTSESFNGNTISIQLEKPLEINLSSEAMEELSFNKEDYLQEDMYSTTEFFDTEITDNDNEFTTGTTERLRTDENLKKNIPDKNIKETTLDENTTLVASDEEESLIEHENSDESSEEIELLYRTLYTTYTYLTTFFHEKTTSISSHTEVVTNVITSTIEVENDSQQNSEEVSLESKMFSATPHNSIEELSITKTFSKFMVPSEVENFVREEDNMSPEKVTITNQLNDENHKIETYYTTYTYYTTIFVEGETEVMSRTEVYTNLITSPLAIEPTKTQNNFAEIAITDTLIPKEYDNIFENLILDTIIQKSSDISGKETSSQLQYSTMSRHPSSTIELQDYDITLMTDIRYSSSNGDKQIINNPKALIKRNDTIDDQIISESNTDEIVPSATLLLQTSFTTFTYYTTMYSGTNSNVVSHLETITSVATETLTPSKMITFDEEAVTQPVTYFTTFTYWTKLTKYGDVTTISREETITNIATPMTITPTSTNEISHEQETVILNSNSDLKVENKVDITPSAPENSIISMPFDVNVSKIEPTTYYTTYTYYTTSYEANKTLTDSRFETITNVVTPTLTLQNTSFAQQKDSKDDEKETKINVETSPIEKLNYILFDYKKIIDAEGVSTLFLTTQIIPSAAEDGQITEFTTSTSSLYVDEVKKALLQNTASVNTEENNEGSASRTYKTGLVRLIDGTKIANSTTTLYQSKVIGTIINNRYAQIIESTSSFLYETTKFQQQNSVLVPTPTPTENIIGITQQAVLSSEETTETNIESSDENIDEKDLQHDNILSKKRTFTPVIRPFASRNRPLFAPKKNNLLPSSATIITRSDFTPTITATPALKSTNNRFGSTRKSSSINTSNFNPSSSRRFSRPSRISNNGSQIYTSSTTGINFGGIRNRLSSSIQLSSLPGGRRSSSLLRPTSAGNYRSPFSSVYAGNSRLRIKSTSTFNAAQQITLKTQKPENDISEEETSTKETPNDDDDANVEAVNSNKLKQNNSLLRFRRPLSRPSGFTLTNRPIISNNSISSRRSPISGRSKDQTTTTSTAISTTSKPAQPRSFQRPVVNLNRSRPQSSLFPPRGLFQPKSISTAVEEPITDKKTNVEETDSDDDSEYEDDDDAEVDSLDDDGNRRRRSNTKQVQKLKTNNLLNKNINDKLIGRVKNRSDKKRERRSAENNFSNRSNLRTNFRRGRPTTSNEPQSYNTDDIGSVTPISTTTTRSRLSSRFGTRYQIFGMQHATTAAITTTANNRAIRPTRPSIGRTQFTLREKDATTATQKGLSRTSSTSSFRRPKTSTASTRRTSHTSPNNRRLKNFATNNVPLDNSRTTISRNRNSSNNRGRGMTTVRSRSRNEFVEPIFDGIITITHVVPAEATIPVVNGKITEYKNIITAKTSTEVVSSQQYTRYVGNNGQTTLALVHEESSTNFAGATEVTQFILHETPTTSVTFTPTTIRGRKTSFSHIIPSTIYSVENVVSTLQPQISANAPLANILLSQLLLGNIGLPSNPLLEALGGAITQSMQIPAVSNLAPPVPVTEFRTHTSTYVTTLFEGTSTVLPVTFQGKKILTTIFDTSAETITATEFITDTIVTTPTLQQQPAAQVNSLLLQQLLLQQQPQQQVENSSKNTILPKQLLYNENLQDIDTNNVRMSSENDDIDDEIRVIEETLSHKTGRKKLRKSGKGSKRNKQQKQLDEDQNSSVITLYVSGRRPGEFSTILSTVKADYESTLHKREADSNIHATTAIENIEDFYTSDGSEKINNYAIPDVIDSAPEVQRPHVNNEDTDLILAFNSIEPNYDIQQQTESLESIVGDVILWHAKTTHNLSKMTKTNSMEVVSTMHLTNVKHFQENELSNIHFLE
ncbi:mucin-17 isoform X2 [Teleopsis dalmanni]|nr:mucin-17 isoform X2 [Teleopsis dalmanni]